MVDPARPAPAKTHMVLPTAWNRVITRKKTDRQGFREDCAALQLHEMLRRKILSKEEVVSRGLNCPWSAFPHTVPPHGRSIPEHCGFELFSRWFLAGFSVVCSRGLPLVVRAKWLDPQGYLATQ